MYSDRPELDFDPDSISALTEKRQAQWNKIQNANFLTRNEKRQAAGYGPVPGGDEDDDGGNDDEDGPAAKFNPYHDPTNGQFTSGPGGAADDVSNIDDPPIEPVYPIESALLAILGGSLAGLAEGAGVTADAAGPLGNVIGGAADSIESDISDVWQNISETLMPDGEPVGEAGSDPTIRELPGGEDAAQEMLGQLSQGGTPYEGNYPGTGYDMPNGGFIGYRPMSNSGEPTIDVKIPNIVIRKIKFLPGDE